MAPVSAAWLWPSGACRHGRTWGPPCLEPPGLMARTSSPRPAWSVHRLYCSLAQTQPELRVFPAGNGLKTCHSIPPPGNEQQRLSCPGPRRGDVAAPSTGGCIGKRDQVGIVPGWSSMIGNHGLLWGCEGRGAKHRVHGAAGTGWVLLPVQPVTPTDSLDPPHRPPQHLLEANSKWHGPVPALLRDDALKHKLLCCSVPWPEPVVHGDSGARGPHCGVAGGAGHADDVVVS